jgi:hypothetical protein
MKRLAWAAVAALSSVLLAGCGDETIHHRNPPHDPPDYHGVPTDVRPPSVLDAPATPSGSQLQPQ